MSKLTHLLWHKFLRRPYRLATPVNAGNGAPVILLHGVASSSVSWSRTIEYLTEIPARIVAIDLLGFGESPKPEESDYDIQTHAKAVIRAIERLHLSEPSVLVGHSMGCLVAVHVAKLRPDLVKKMILYEIPLYEGLPAKRRYNLRRDLYYAMYRRIVRYPNYSPANVRALQKIVVRVMGFEVTRETWNSFVRSLKNTVMAQTTLEDMKVLKTPTEIIYGSLDMVVIRGKPKNFFGTNAEHISARSIREVHGISPRASMFLAGRIAEAVGLSEAQIIAKLPRYKRYLKSPKTKIVKARKS
jgi:pimeloyl-ACP methyl ester carboxylesterase